MSLPFWRSQRERLWNRLNEFDPTIMHIATPDIMGIIAAEWAYEKQIPIVCSYHTRFNTYLKYYYLGFVEDVLWDGFRIFYNHYCLQTYVPSQVKLFRLLV